MRLPLLVFVLLVGCSDPAGLRPVDDAPADGTPDDDDSAATDDDDSALPPFLCGPLTASPEGAWVPLGTSVEGAWPACARQTHASAGAAGMTVALRLDGPAAHLRAVDLLGATLAEGEGAIDVALTRAGEFLIEIEPAVPEEPGAYTLSASCTDGCDREFTRYPIVLMHGMAGTDEYFNVLTYYYDVVDTLDEAGFQAFTPAVDALASTPDRAAQWSAHLDALQADGWGRRFHLIAHSQGGLDARYLVGAMGEGDRVATITTIATPHHGSELGDVAEGAVDVAPAIVPLLQDAITLLTEALGLGEAELLGSLSSVTTEAVAEFNATVPDDPAVAYFSWSARSCALLEPFCIADMQGEIVAPYLVPTYRILELLAGENDGIVPTASGVWGEHLGTLGADHFDEVGQIAGITDGAYDHRAFYLGEARRLAGDGG
jgi:triacylglycerol esterase/lipase EstA (alpha/beta hydrolase family)